MPAVMKMAVAVRAALKESTADLGIRTLALTLATKLDGGMRSELAYASMAKELRQVLIYIASVDKGSEDDLNAFLRGLSSEVGDSPIA
jgi:hypothetical protein